MGDGHIRDSYRESVLSLDSSTFRLLSLVDLYPRPFTASETCVAADDTESCWLAAACRSWAFLQARRLLRLTHH